MNRIRVMLLDDDPLFAKVIAAGLKARNIDCEWHGNAETLLDAVYRDGVPDVFVLDYYLGTLRDTGLTVCRRLTLLFAAPIIMLTSNQHTDTVIECLNAGATQYVTKPCDMGELVARINAVLRSVRVTPTGLSQAPLPAADQEDTAITFHGLTLYPNRREIHWLRDTESTLRITEREFNLLKLFLKTPDQTLSRADAYRRLYHHEMAPENRSIDVLVARLRNRLKTLGAELSLQKLRGLGYKLVATKPAQ